LLSPHGRRRRHVYRSRSVVLVHRETIPHRNLATTGSIVTANFTGQSNGTHLATVAVNFVDYKLQEHDVFETIERMRQTVGRNIAGGRVLVNNWPGLALENLENRQDLKVTMDHRDVLAEIVKNRLGNSNLGVVFPDFVPTMRGVTT